MYDELSLGKKTSQKQNKTMDSNIQAHHEWVQTSENNQNSTSCRTKSFVFVRRGPGRQWTVTKRRLSAFRQFVSRSLQQVAQLVLEVFGMLHTGGGTHTNKHERLLLWPPPPQITTSAGFSKLRRVVLRLTFSEWPPACGRRSQRSYQQDFHSLNQCFTSSQLCLILTGIVNVWWL